MTKAKKVHPVEFYERARIAQAVYFVTTIHNGWDRQTMTVDRPQQRHATAIEAIAIARTNPRVMVYAVLANGASIHVARSSYATLAS